MLRVSNLTKVYKTKGGVTVKALDNVSAIFPETGMVFLLGKSGSGKSTLLNVCGGLDTPTSGEIIVKDRSSKNFSQSDFDSYRNTFVGFIFQEYNILNEFTVEENIALALELQGKAKDKDAINNLLEQVDLKGFAKRKPNTLSGGQKQRIAIARALIKEPEIIMADEPTGALDSVTGRQVLETLKKLSKDKLVIVVSHDRDFAETYGDRIIELKDGKIISDITKTEKNQENISSNVSVISDVLCIKKGSILTDEDFESIKDFLNNSETDVIVAKGTKDVEAFKKLSRITSDGKKEVFENTDENKVNINKYSKEDSKFITSKLPLRHAFKIGTSSLKNKPIRLFFTIALCTISFIMFGLLSTMTFYDSEATFKQTLKDSNDSFIKLNKNYKVNEITYQNGEKDYEFTYDQETNFTDNELNEYISRFGKATFGGVYFDMSFNVQSQTSQYWINRINSVGYLPSDNTLREKIQGTYPIKEDEIVISSYTANVIFENKIYDNKTNKIIELNNKEDIIGKKIIIGGYTYKVVGIIDSGAIDSKYDEILTSNDNNRLIYEFQSILTDGLHLTAFVSKERFDVIANESKAYNDYIGDSFNNRRIVTSLNKNGKYNFEEWSNSSYSEYSIKKDDKFYMFDQNKTEPSDNEVIVSKDMFYKLMMDYFSDMSNENSYKYYELANQLYNKSIHQENKETLEWESIPLTEQQKESKFNELLNILKKEKIELKIGVRLFDDINQTSIGEMKELTVIGIWDYQNVLYQDLRILLSDNLTNELWNIQKVNINYYSEYSSNYKEDKDAIYNTIYLEYNKSDDKTNEIWNIYENDKYNPDDSRLTLQGYTIDNLEMIDSLIEELSKVFFYVGLALAVFAALLFSNFISVSISYKKREIGILRAIGARSFDVFKIFFSESFVITMICIILSIIGSASLCSILNQELSKGIGASVFVFGIVSLLLIILISLLTAVIATFLPVYNAAKKKPVDSIRSI